MPKRKIKSTEAATAEIFFCDEQHLHINLADEDENDIADIALDFDAGLDLVQGLLAQIEEMTGLMFVVIDPDETDDDDPIGPTVGNA